MPEALLISGLILYTAVIGTILWRMLAFRRGVSFQPQTSLSTVIDPQIDNLAYYLISGSRLLIKQIYILLILSGHNLIKFFKFLIIKIEKRFAKIVNQVKGKGEISQKGAVSLFLKEIKADQNKKREDQSNLS